MADTFDPTKRAKPSYPYVEFVKVKRFNSGANQTQEEIAVPVFINMDTVQREIASFNNLRTQSKMTLVGYGNLDKPKFNEIRRLLDAELHQSPKVQKYMSALEEKVEKAKANVKQAG